MTCRIDLHRALARHFTLASSLLALPPALPLYVRDEAWILEGNTVMRHGRYRVYVSGLWGLCAPACSVCWRSGEALSVPRHGPLSCMTVMTILVRDAYSRFLLQWWARGDSSAPGRALAAAQVAPGIGTGPSRPAVGAESPTSTFVGHGAPAPLRQRAQPFRFFGAVFAQTFAF